MSRFILKAKAFDYDIPEIDIYNDDDELLYNENKEEEFKLDLNSTEEENENFLALLNATAQAEDSIHSDISQAINYINLVNSTAQADAEHASNDLTKKIKGKGVSNKTKIKAPADIVKTFKNNLQTLIYYYPDDSELARLINIKTNIYNFLNLYFK